MSKCSFCDAEEVQETPLCQSCGSLRYPVARAANLTPSASRQEKLKLSATIAVAIFTPGSFFVLALVGANKLNSRLKKSKF